MKTRLPLVALGCAIALLLAVSSQAAAAPVTCGQSLTADTTLDADLICPGNGLTLDAKNITLNLNGHTISAAAPFNAATGIGANRVGDKLVGPGTIDGFTTGMQFGALNGQAANQVVSNVTVSNSGEEAMDFSGSKAQVLDNTISNAGYIGIDVSGNGAVVQGNTISAVQTAGIYVEADRTNVLANTITGTYNGPGGSGIEVTSNAGASVVQGNHSDSNVGDGIHVGSRRTTITGNSANSNSGWGIWAVPGVRDGGGNTATGNVLGACLNVSC